MAYYNEKSCQKREFSHFKQLYTRFHFKCFFFFFFFFSCYDYLFRFLNFAVVYNLFISTSVILLPRFPKIGVGLFISVDEIATEFLLVRMNIWPLWYYDSVISELKGIEVIFCQEFWIQYLMTS